VLLIDLYARAESARIQRETSHIHQKKYFRARRRAENSYLDSGYRIDEEKPETLEPSVHGKEEKEDEGPRESSLRRVGGGGGDLEIREDSNGEELAPIVNYIHPRAATCGKISLVRGRNNYCARAHSLLPGEREGGGGGVD